MYEFGKEIDYGVGSITQLTPKKTGVLDVKVNDVSVVSDGIAEIQISDILSDYQVSSDESLLTDDKTIVGAINLLYTNIGDINTLLDTINGEII